jgi:hypothetical protein
VLWLPALDCADRLSRVSGRNKARASRIGADPTPRPGLLKTALLPAPFWCTKRVESAHFNWRWRERPALALLAWEACSRPAGERTPRPSRVNWNGN